MGISPGQGGGGGSLVLLHDSGFIVSPVATLGVASGLSQEFDDLVISFQGRCDHTTRLSIVAIINGDVDNAHYVSAFHTGGTTHEVGRHPSTDLVRRIGTAAGATTNPARNASLTALIANYADSTFNKLIGSETNEYSSDNQNDIWTGGHTVARHFNTDPVTGFQIALESSVGARFFTAGRLTISGRKAA